MQWLKYCIEIIPHDFRARFETAYILNPNSAAIKYLRRLWNITAGAYLVDVIIVALRLLSGSHLSSQVKACSSILELQTFVPVSATAPLVYASKHVYRLVIEFLIHID
jgi:hypothetical protein